MLVYFVFVLGIGFALKRYMRTSNDFFLAGRSIPAWVCGLAFISANLGAQEVIGMGASGAKYGIVVSHFYWIGAIPAMVFVGIFMMPFYYGSKARSVPEFLRLRFDEKTRAVNAFSFAIMTVLSSGISMYAMAILIQTLGLFHGVIPDAYIFHVSVFLSAIIVLGYIFLGGLTSAIYNEVLQFFLIIAGFLPLVLIGLKNVGGWSGLKASLPQAYTHSWQGMAHANTNPLGVEVFGLAMGLGFVLSFGYWCTDFLVIQTAMATDTQENARRVPLIAAIPKMFFPFLVILPGLLAIGAFFNDTATTERTVNGAIVRETYIPSEVERMGQGLVPAKTDPLTGKIVLDASGKPLLDYDLAIPSMLLHYFPTGILGLGLTALLASFMSGMAGNVTAFNTVWTYDLYQSYIRKGASDKHYLRMGHAATVFGVLLGVAAAYLAAAFNNIMDLLQLVFAFVNAPVFATFLLGMFWKRTTGHGAFFGLLAGTLSAAVFHGLSLPAGAVPGVKGGWITPEFVFRSEMGQNFYVGIVAWSTCFVLTVLVSFATRRNKTDAELQGLVYSLTPRPASDAGEPWYKRPVLVGVLVLAATLILNILFR